YQEFSRSMLHNLLLWDDSGFVSCLLVPFLWLIHITMMHERNPIASTIQPESAFWAGTPQNEIVRLQCNE
ncbi:MAG TPA: hypothetical protein PKY11_06205, partial [Kiritimatiellia bacterium]|nr:hypothetical protein [Kiritimatiellia bacterium]